MKSVNSVNSVNDDHTQSKEHTSSLDHFVGDTYPNVGHSEVHIRHTEHALESIVFPQICTVYKLCTYTFM